MNQPFITGFTKRAQEAGATQEQIEAMLKQALLGQEIYDPNISSETLKQLGTTHDQLMNTGMHDALQNAFTKLPQARLQGVPTDRIMEFVKRTLPKAPEFHEADPGVGAHFADDLANKGNKLWSGVKGLFH